MPFFNEFQKLTFDIPSGWIFIVEDDQLKFLAIPEQVPTANEYQSLAFHIAGREDREPDEGLPDRHRQFLEYWTRRESRTIIRQVAALASEYGGSLEFDLPYADGYGTGLSGRVRLWDKPILPVLLQIEIARLHWRLTVAHSLKNPRDTVNRLRRELARNQSLSGLLDLLARESNVASVAPLLSKVGEFGDRDLISDIAEWIIGQAGNRRSKSASAPTCSYCGRLYRRVKAQGADPVKPYCQKCRWRHEHFIRQESENYSSL